MLLRVAAPWRCCELLPVDCLLLLSTAVAAGCVLLLLLRVAACVLLAGCFLLRHAFSCRVCQLLAGAVTAVASCCAVRALALICVLLRRGAILFVVLASACCSFVHNRSNVDTKYFQCNAVLNDCNTWASHVRLIDVMG